ncbi:MAG: response regulator [Rhodomicrobium sp.]
MRERNNAVAKYIEAEEECRNSSNIFATLNAIRCEFAIRNGHDSYIAQRNEGGKKNVPINWKCLQVKGLKRRVSAAGYKQNRLSALIAYARRGIEKYWNPSCAASTWEKVTRVREKEKGAISAATILVVEDETLILMMIADHLRDAGLTVIEAKHAGEALAILSKSAAIDFVITDVRMPGGLDGLALAKCVKQQKTTIPVIVVSGDLSHAPSQEIANAFFSKPYDLNVVLTRVKELLNVTRRDASPRWSSQTSLRAP